MGRDAISMGALAIVCSGEWAGLIRGAPPRFIRNTTTL